MALKIAPAHYEKMKSALLVVLKKHPGSAEWYREKGYTDKRYRWDLFHAAEIDGRAICFWISDTLYPAGLNDDHIDSALRRIVKEATDGSGR